MNINKIICLIILFLGNAAHSMNTKSDNIVAEINEQLLKNPTKLDLSFKKIGSEGISALEIALATRPIKHLNLVRTRITNADLDRIFKAILKNPDPQLLVLDISYNVFEDSGAQSIANFFTSYHNLEKLWMYDPNSKITGSGLTAIFNSLTHPQTELKMLDIAGIKIKEASSALVNLLATTKIETLNLNGTGIDADLLKNICDSIKANENNRLEYLSLDRNKIGFEGAQIIADLLTTNTSLKRLSLYDTQITIPGAEIIQDAVENKNLTIEEIRLSNDLQDVTQAMKKVLQRNKIRNKSLSNFL